ncbi:MAG TPA: NmrA family NAD(P)-binding protein [Bordetella sp.]
MKILIYGATGMVGQGVLRECLDAPDVASVVAIGRTPLGMRHPKLQEIVRPDLYRYDGLETQLSGFDACFFCLGTSSAGKSEAVYTRITYDLTMAAASLLARLNPDMVFTYVSGASTDSSEQGRAMWARVKGRTENALLKLPFKAAYMFRPGLIRATDGSVSKTPAYRFLYGLLAWLIPLLHRAFPNQVVSTREIGKVMLSLARAPAGKPIYEIRDIRAALDRLG